MSRAAAERLAAIARKDSRLIIGLMSGTSLDGLDIALCRIQGNGFDTELSLTQFLTVPYDQAFQQRIRQSASKRDTDLQEITVLNAVIAEKHAGLIQQALGEWRIRPEEIDLIASHGQTIFHAPRSLHQNSNDPHATLQLGDGDRIAKTTGITTISDFRQKNTAGGGEGAPLVAYGDLLLYSSPDQDRILLNIGGIANFTLLPALSRQAPVMSSDIGPGNTLMDAIVSAHFPPLTYDHEARLAAAGRCHEPLLNALLSDPLLKTPLPRTTGPEHYSLNFLRQHLDRIDDKLSNEDILNTLNEFSATTIINALTEIDGTPKIFVSGGGIHNPLLMERIKSKLPGRHFAPMSALGLNPDAKEAVLFAVLANECVAGDPSVFEGRITGAPAVSMGKVSFPD